MRITLYLGRQLGLCLFLTWALIQSSLLLLLGAFLLMRWPLLARLPASETLSYLFLEIGPTSLALALPLGLALFLQKTRQTGELQAIALLPLGPIRSRLGMILPLLPFCLLFFFWAGELAPLNRAKLEQRLGNPLLLLAGGRYEELDRAASRLGGLALAYESVENQALVGVALLRREGPNWTALSANRLELQPPSRLRLEDGQVWTSAPSPMREIRFQQLDLDVLGNPLGSQWNPAKLHARAWWMSWSLVMGLALVLSLLGRRGSPGLPSRLAAWLLPPLLFWLGASA